MDSEHKNDFIEDSFSLDDLKVPKKEKEAKPEKIKKEKKEKKEKVKKEKPKEEVIVEVVNAPIVELLAPSDIEEKPKTNIVNILAILGFVSIVSLFLFIVISLIANSQINEAENKDAANVPIYDQAEITEILDNNEDQFTNLQTKYNNNKDIVAYISLFDTYINSPVAMSGDNVYYQDHDLYKNLNIDGAVYLDSTSDIKEFGQNTIVYGRTDIANKQFYDLTLFEDEDFYNKNRFINLDTIYNNSVWKIYSYYKIEDDNFYLKNNFENDEFKTYIVGTKNMSIYPVDVDVTENDKVLTLTSQKLDGVRYVLHAKLEKVN